MPEACLVNKKITKAFFKRNFELTLSESKFLDDFSVFIQIDWLASIKPENSNIIAFTSAQSTIEEVVIIAVQTNDADFDKNKQKIAELIQKFIPYHILLCIYSENQFVLNVAEKRTNQNDSTKRTIEKQYFTENISIAKYSDKQRAFVNSLAFSLLDKLNLKTLFESYVSRIIAIHTADVLTSFEIRSSERSKQDIQNLELISLLKSEIVTLQNKANLETQLNILVEVNNAIQEKRKEIKNLENIITS